MPFPIALWTLSAFLGFMCKMALFALSPAFRLTTSHFYCTIFRVARFLGVQLVKMHQSSPWITHSSISIKIVVGIVMSMCGKVKAG